MPVTLVGVATRQPRLRAVGGVLRKPLDEASEGWRGLGAPGPPASGQPLAWAMVPVWGLGWQCLVGPWCLGRVAAGLSPETHSMGPGPEQG
jgi:hypothetical protein